MYQFLINSFSNLKKEIWLLAVLMLINRAGMMVIPFMSIYFINELGFSKSSAGIVVACFGTGALLGSYMGGWLTDKYGSYRVMLYALLAGTVGFWVMALLQDFWLLCIWTFLLALAADPVRPAMFTAVADWSDEDNLTRGISLVRMAVNLGIAIGPAVGGFLVHYFGYHWLFIIDGGTCMLAAIFLVLTLAHLRHRRQSADDNKSILAPSISPYKDYQMLIFLVFNIVCLTGFFQILNATPVFLKEVYQITEAQVGLFFTINGLFIFLIEMPIIYALERVKKDYGPLLIGSMMIAISYLCFLLFDNIWLAIGIHLFLISFGEIISFPFITSIAIKGVPSEHRGKYMGAVTTGFSLAFVVAPLIGLPIVELVGFTSYWMMCFVMIMLGVLGLWIIRSKIISRGIN